MALDKSTLKASLKTIFETAGNNSESVATAMADAIEAYVKGAEVTVTAIIGEVAVQGSATAQANVTPLTFKGGDLTHTGGLS